MAQDAPGLLLVSAGLSWASPGLSWASPGPLMGLRLASWASDGPEMYAWQGDGEAIHRDESLIPHLNHIRSDDTVNAVLATLTAESF